MSAECVLLGFVAGFGFGLHVSTMSVLSAYVVCARSTYCEATNTADPIVIIHKLNE